MIKTYYINSLSGYKPQPYVRKELRELKTRGILLTQIPVDWYALDTLEQVIERVKAGVEEALDDGHQVVLIGISAGGSLALSVFLRW